MISVRIFTSVRQLYLLTLLGVVFARISAVEELSIEKLNSDHSKDKLKENVDNENVEDILQGDDHTVEHCLELGDSVDCFQGSQNSQQFHRF